MGVNVLYQSSLAKRLRLNHDYLKERKLESLQKRTLLFLVLACEKPKYPLFSDFGLYQALLSLIKEKMNESDDTSKQLAYDLAEDVKKTLNLNYADNLSDYQMKEKIRDLLDSGYLGYTEFLIDFNDFYRLD